MDEEYFVGEVWKRPPFGDRGPTRRAVTAVLETLGERLPANVARSLAEVLPDDLAPKVLAGPAGQGFPLPEFLARVARREGIDHHDALRHAQLVVGLLDEVAPDDEMDAVRAGLSDDFRVLFAIADRHRARR